MNNTDKLLRAFIEASGFEIENKQAQSSCACAVFTNQGCQRCNFRGFTIAIDYKVTKKEVDSILIDVRMIKETIDILERCQFRGDRNVDYVMDMISELNEVLNENT